MEMLRKMLVKNKGKGEYCQERWPGLGGDVADWIWVWHLTLHLLCVIFKKHACRWEWATVKGRCCLRRWITGLFIIGFDCRTRLNDIGLNYARFCGGGGGANRSCSSGACSGGKGCSCRRSGCCNQLFTSHIAACTCVTFKWLLFCHTFWNKLPDFFLSWQIKHIVPSASPHAKMVVSKLSFIARNFAFTSAGESSMQPIVTVFPSEQ